MKSSRMSGLTYRLKSDVTFFDILEKKSLAIAFNGLQKDQKSLFQTNSKDHSKSLLQESLQKLNSDIIWMDKALIVNFNLSPTVTKKNIFFEEASHSDVSVCIIVYKQKKVQFPTFRHLNVCSSLCCCLCFYLYGRSINHLMEVNYSKRNRFSSFYEKMYDLRVEMKLILGG